MGVYYEKNHLTYGVVSNICQECIKDRCDEVNPVIKKKINKFHRNNGSYLLFLSPRTTLHTDCLRAGPEVWELQCQMTKDNLTLFSGRPAVQHMRIGNSWIEVVSDLRQQTTQEENRWFLSNPPILNWTISGQRYGHHGAGWYFWPFWEEKIRTKYQ